VTPKLISGCMHMSFFVKEVVVGAKMNNSVTGTAHFYIKYFIFKLHTSIYKQK